MNPSLQIRAAGSLEAALRTLLPRFEAAIGTTVEAEFAPAGFLRQKIEDGAATDLFLSANLEHPQGLAASFGGVARAFASNALCAIARPGFGSPSGDLLSTLLDPRVRVAMSTPGADPSGDYALLMFDRAEALVPGAAAALRRKALQLAGGPEHGQNAPPGGTVYAHALHNGDADLFITYQTNGHLVMRELPGARIIALPGALAVGADYGMLLLSDNAGAARLADFLLSSEGQAGLRKFGFGPPRE